MNGAANQLRGFLAAGGRVLTTPSGSTEITFDVGLIFGRDVPEDLGEDRYRACRAFVQGYGSPAGARFAARAVRLLGVATSDGWKLLEVNQ